MCSSRFIVFIVLECRPCGLGSVCLYIQQHREGSPTSLLSEFPPSLSPPFSFSLPVATSFPPYLSYIQSLGTEYWGKHKYV